jgi:hypothetical protein
MRLDKRTDTAHDGKWKEARIGRKMHEMQKRVPIYLGKKRIPLEVTDI